MMISDVTERSSEVTHSPGDHLLAHGRPNPLPVLTTAIKFYEEHMIYYFSLFDYLLILCEFVHSTYANISGVCQPLIL